MKDYSALLLSALALWTGSLAASSTHYLVLPNSLVLVLCSLFSTDAKTAGVDGQMNNLTPLFLHVITLF